MNIKEIQKLADDLSKSKEELQMSGRSRWEGVGGG